MMCSDQAKTHLETEYERYLSGSQQLDSSEEALGSNEFERQVIALSLEETLLHLSVWVSLDEGKVQKDKLVAC